MTHPNVTINETIAAAYTEFLHQEGAHDRSYDFADFLRGRFTRAGYTVIETGHPRHVIDLREDGWTIQHPLACRARGELFSCPYNQAARDLVEPPVLGQFEVGLNDAGDQLVIGDRVEDVTP